MAVTAITQALGLTHWKAAACIRVIGLAPTLPSGSGYFRSFELFFLNFGYAPADDVNLSVATLFPVTGDVLMLSVGAASVKKEFRYAMSPSHRSPRRRT